MRFELHKIKYLIGCLTGKFRYRSWIKYEEDIGYGYSCVHLYPTTGTINFNRPLSQPPGGAEFNVTTAKTSPIMFSKD